MDHRCPLHDYGNPPRSLYLDAYRTGGSSREYDSGCVKKQVISLLLIQNQPIAGEGARATKANLLDYPVILVGANLPIHPVLIIHGGAWAIPDDMVEAHLQGVRNALAAGWRVLSRGGSALDAAEESVVVMEDDETFDAGRGSFLNRDGKVQLDALIMDGATLAAGGVGCVEHLRNPVRAARKILSDSPHVYFVAEGAEKFAAQHGIPLCKNEDLIIPREVERLRVFQAQAATQKQDLFAPAISHDTVGAVALDHHGNLAAATSTGGTLNKAPGRLGDSSLIGCGCFADNKTAAASTTGWGEPIMKLVLAKWAADRVGAGNLPEWVAAEAINYLQARVSGHGGIILLDARGRFGIAHNTPRMAWAVKNSSEEASGITRQL